MSPVPNLFHQDIMRNLAALLNDYLKKTPIGKFYFAPCDVYLDDLNVVQPDLLFVSKARSSILQSDGVRGAPDLVIEILSPSTARLDLESKRNVYARSGVIEMWIVVPETRQIQIYRLQENPARPSVIHEQVDTFGSALFPGLDISGQAIFAV